MTLAQDIAKWIKKQVKDAGKKGIVMGLSGGVDSAVVAALSKIAMGDNVLALLLPCKSNSEDSECGLDVAKKFDIRTKKIALDKIYEDFEKICPEANHLAKANLKPRLRMTTLYYFANTLNYLVAGTGNKSEATVGYFTKYGDGGIDILPIGDLLKTEVRKLAEELEIPRKIIDRHPSAGLWEGQTDESEMGITYDELDKTISAIENKKTETIDKKILSKIKKMMESSEHKRAKAPVFTKGDKK